LSLILSSFGIAAAASPYYAPTGLGYVAGVTGSYAMAINAGGQVVGYVGNPGFVGMSGSAFLWSGGTMTDLGVLGGVPYPASNQQPLIIPSLSVATAINSSGLVAGWSDDSTNTEYGYKYSGGTMTGLGSSAGASYYGNYGPANALDNYLPEGSGSSFGNFGINAAGHIAGSNWFYNGSSVESLGDVTVYGINDSDQIVGVNDDFGTSLFGHALLFSGGATIDLGTGPGSYGEAYAINQGGVMAGYSANGHAQKITYSGGTAVWTDLGTLGGPNSASLGINDSGTIVGYSDVSSGTQHAFITVGGAMTDLNALLPAGSPWTLNFATGINDSGQICGIGAVGGQEQAFRLTPALAGDANLDGRVDINDLTIVLAHYGQTAMTWAQGEFTGDGTVDINDLTIVLANYGHSLAGASAAGIAAVPEPGMLALAAAGLTGLLACVRRKQKCAKSSDD
jgi:probable HAF family extracellular repeat protein